MHRLLMLLMERKMIQRTVKTLRKFVTFRFIMEIFKVFLPNQIFVIKYQRRCTKYFVSLKRGSTMSMTIFAIFRVNSKCTDGTVQQEVVGLQLLFIKTSKVFKSIKFMIQSAKAFVLK